MYTEHKNSVGMHTPFTQNTLLTLRYSAMYDGPLPQVKRTFDRRPEVMVSLFTSCLLPSFFAHRLARSRIPLNPETAALHLIDIGPLAWLLLLCWLPRRALTGPYYVQYIRSLYDICVKNISIRHTTVLAGRGTKLSLQPFSLSSRGSI